VNRKKKEDLLKFEKEWAKIRNLETKLGNANKHQ
jgi:hypothetical protein